MKQWLDFWEKCKGKKGSPVLIGLLVGLLLLVITWPDNSSKKQNTQTKTNAPAVENNVRNTEDLAQERTQRMEQRLEEVLREVDGVGEVKVMITLRSCGAYIVEKDTRTSNSQNTQDQSGDKARRMHRISKRTRFLKSRKTERKRRMSKKSQSRKWKV